MNFDILVWWSPVYPLYNCCIRNPQYMLVDTIYSSCSNIATVWHQSSHQLTTFPVILQVSWLGSAIWWQILHPPEDTTRPWALSPMTRGGPERTPTHLPFPLRKWSGESTPFPIPTGGMRDMQEPHWPSNTKHLHTTQNSEPYKSNIDTSVIIIYTCLRQ